MRAKRKKPASRTRSTRRIGAAFRVPGKRLTLKKWIHGRRCVVSVEVEAVIPDADTSEACLEPATIKWLDQVQRMADEGDVAALARIGEVYVRRRRSA
jgi:hypothetical protein